MEKQLSNALQFYQYCIDDGKLLPDNYYSTEDNTIMIQWDSEDTGKWPTGDRGCIAIGIVRWVAYFHNTLEDVRYAEGYIKDLNTDWIPKWR